MSVYDQQINSYDDATPQVRVISDAIFLIDPVDTPFIQAVGGLDAARSKFKLQQNGKKIEILEDEHEPLTGAVNQTAAVATDATQFTAADASIFQDGDVILIDSEYMVVSAVNLTSNLVTVYSRSYGGTNATHATDAAIEIVGMARLEGDDADFGPIVDITAPFNYTSIFEKAINVSGTEQALDQYGMSNKFSYESMKAIPAKNRLIEKMAFHGVRAVGTASGPRSAGGLRTFITDNTVNAGGGIAKTDVDNLSEAIYNDGGNPDLFVCNPGVAADLRALLDSSSFVRMTQENTKFGMRPVMEIQSQFHNLRVVPSRFAPVGWAYMLQSNKVGYYTLRPWQEKRLSVTGDSIKGEVLTELSLLVANDKAHGYIYGLTS